MMPVAPEISVRQLLERDVAALQPLVNQALSATIYSAPMDEEAVMAQVMAAEPVTVFPTRWRNNRCLGAWRAGQLLGYIHVAVGFDGESLDLPDYRPLGLLRFLALPARDDLVEPVATRLFEAADEYWRQAGVGYVKAFHVSTGYPACQAGAGVLPGDWREHFRLLTAHDYQLADRYYALGRPLDLPIEEFIPLAELSIVYRGEKHDRRYELYRRTNRLGHARLVRVDLAAAGRARPVGLLAELTVDPAWRQQDLGTLLLSRVINDATLQEYSELVAYVTLAQGPAMNLLSQQGFEELHYRGYVLERTMQT